jgi:hypothetical protein
MSPHAGRTAFTLALFVTIPALVLLFLEPRESAEFVITALTFAIGLVFIALVAFVVRRSMR